PGGLQHDPAAAARRLQRADRAAATQRGRRCRANPAIWMADPPGALPAPVHRSGAQPVRVDYRPAYQLFVGIASGTVAMLARARYRTVQVLRQVSPRVSAEDRALVAAILPPGLLTLFERQRAGDQAH